MRWIWIDKFVEFVPGKSAVAIKRPSPDEEYFQDHLPGYPVMPPSLMIEGMAQTAGILVGQARDFRERVILAKVRLAKFDSYPRPHDRIAYHVTIDSLEDAGATTTGIVTCNDQPIGQVDLMFSHVNQSQTDLALPDHNFVFGEQFRSLLENYRLDELRNAETPKR